MFTLAVFYMHNPRHNLTLVVDLWLICYW